MANGSITDNTLEWPSWTEITDALTLSDYNTMIVVLGTTLLGIAAGVVGTFAYLRKRAMVGDALSHATLPGIAIMFMLVGDKHLPALLFGAAVTGILGVLSVIGLRSFSRIKEDAAIGIVLSVFFGAGMVLVSLVQQMNTGSPSGLDRFIYGKAAGMIKQDAMFIGITATIVLLGVILFFKELRIICFDQQFAAAQGWPVVLIDLVMMGLVVLTTVVGLQAVGLILVVALLIIPAAAARFWTDELRGMTIIAGMLGALSGYFGSTFSALLPRLPTGAVIVLCAGFFFFLSMFFAPRRGIFANLIRRYSLSRKIAHQNLLRSLAEIEERFGEGIRAPFDTLLAYRSWSVTELRRLLKLASRRHEVTVDTDYKSGLTRSGRTEAVRILRNHRLWEMYLIKHAAIAPSHVDRDADQIEHILSPEIVDELERALAHERQIPPSPHLQEPAV
ncbi:MAG: metal ABC transporter permease [Phycisphaerales bacterium]|nr:metal ABC transporter permease [Phycisphaerales bacterium]